MPKNPKGKKLSPGSKENKDSYPTLELSRKAKRQILRNQVGPYYEVLEEARKYLPQETLITRSKLKLITAQNLQKVREPLKPVSQAHEDSQEVLNETLVNLSSLNETQARVPEGDDFPPLSSSSDESAIINIFDSSPLSQDNLQSTPLKQNPSVEHNSTETSDFFTSAYFDLDFEPNMDIEITFDNKVFKIQDGNIKELLSQVLVAYNRLNQLKLQTNSYQTLNIGELTQLLKEIREFNNAIKTLIDECKQAQLQTNPFENIVTQNNTLYHQASLILGQKKAEEAKRAQEALQAGQAAGAQAPPGDAQPPPGGPQPGPQPQQGNNPGAPPDVIDDLKKEIRFLTRKMDSLNSDLLKLQKQKNQPPKDQPPPKKKGPPLTVKPFKGERKDYLRFKSAFIDRYENTDYSLISLAISLGELLEGEPKQKFHYLLTNPDDDTYNVLWSALDSVYGTEREHKLEKLDKFFKLPDVKIFNPNTISALCTTLEEHWNVLKTTLNDQFLVEDNYIFFSFIRKMPVHETAKFYDYCRATQSKKNFPVFRDWLLSQWECFKNSKDKSPVDKALIMWQTDKLPTFDSSNSLCFFETSDISSLPREQVTMDSCKTAKLEFDDDGNAYVTYEVPQNETHFIAKNGTLHQVGSYVYKTENSDIQKNFKGRFNPRRGSDRGNHQNRPAINFDRQKPNYDMKCAHCKQSGHKVWNCDTFISLGVKLRYASVRDNNLCLRCLNSGHMAKDCRVRFLCDVDKCGKRHHRLLHTAEKSKVLYETHFFQGLADDLDEHFEEHQDKQ